MLKKITTCALLIIPLIAFPVGFGALYGISGAMIALGIVALFYAMILPFSMALESFNFDCLEDFDYDD